MFFKNSTTQSSHVFHMFLSPLLVDKVSQGSRDIKVFRPLFTYLFVWEIYSLRDKCIQIGQRCKPVRTRCDTMRIKSLTYTMEVASLHSAWWKSWEQKAYCCCQLSPWISAGASPRSWHEEVGKFLIESWNPKGLAEINQLQFLLTLIKQHAASCRYIFIVKPDGFWKAISKLWVHFLL